ncbi:MAG: hypothetical protein CME71_10320 [Halobacteriovorax sp.]|nr:hypothetical protein [Halobacteriovorax sp.]
MMTQKKKAKSAVEDNSNSNETPQDVAKQLNEMEFCVFDLETTGGNHSSDKIIEIGMVKVKGQKILAEKDFLIQPGIKIPEFIQRLTSISQKDVADSPMVEEVIDEVLEFMGDAVLVAHNTSFDVPFFNSVLSRMGKPEMKNPSICTNLMTKYLVPSLMNSNLNYMSKIFEIRHKKAHRALDDAKASAELLIRYLNIFLDKGISKINHLYYPRNRYELDRLNFKRGDDLKLIEEKLKILPSSALFTLKGENGIILTALPMTKKKEEIAYAFELLQTQEWENATIKLHGPLIESFIHFAGLFPKLDTTMRHEILNFLWKTHLPKMNQGPHPSLLKEEKGLDKLLGDFFVANHLVPEQYIIYPMAAISHRQELVFRYPGHKKKLLQYINSKASKLAGGKIKRQSVHPQLKDFFESYLVEVAASQKDLYFFKKKKVGTTAAAQDVFFKEFENFLRNNPNKYNFPRNYI